MDFPCYAGLIEDTLDQGKVIVIKKISKAYNIQVHSNSESPLKELFEKVNQNTSSRDFFKSMQTSFPEKEDERYIVPLYSLANQDLTQCVMKALEESNLASFLKEGNTLSVKSQENFVRVSYHDRDEMFSTRDEEVVAESFLNASKLLSNKLK